MAYFKKEDIGKEVTCTKCGKIGKLSLGFPQRVGLVHKHYCPVKYQEKKKEKEIKLQKEIDVLLKNFNGWNLYYDFDRSLFDRFPHKESDFFEDDTKEEILYKEKYQEINIKIKEYMEEKRKHPTDKKIQKMINEL